MNFYSQKCHLSTVYIQYLLSHFGITKTVYVYLYLDRQKCRNYDTSEKVEQSVVFTVVRTCSNVVY